MYLIQCMFKVVIDSLPCNHLQVIVKNHPKVIGIRDTESVEVSLADSPDIQISLFIV